MAQTSIRIRIDEDIKNDAEALFASLGLNLSTAFNIFVRQALNEQAIPFKIKKERTHKSLSERLENFNGDYTFVEWETGKPVGNEVL